MLTDENVDTSNKGVNVSLAGLDFQVAVIIFFIISFADALTRYLRESGTAAFDRRTSAFFSFLSLAIVTILIRCAYRCYELSDRYNDSDKIIDEPAFIRLEGVMIVIVVFSFFIGHPGFISRNHNSKSLAAKKVCTSETSDGTLDADQNHHYDA